MAMAEIQYSAAMAMTEIQYSAAMATTEAARARKPDKPDNGQVCSGGLATATRVRNPENEPEPRSWLLFWHPRGNGRNLNTQDSDWSL